MQIKLTKKYRLIWDSSIKEIPQNYNEEKTGVTSINDNFWNYFESDSLSDIENQIQLENLTIKTDSDSTIELTDGTSL